MLFKKNLKIFSDFHFYTYYATIRWPEILLISPYIIDENLIISRRNLNYLILDISTIPRDEDDDDVDDEKKNLAIFILSIQKYPLDHNIHNVCFSFLPIHSK